MKKRLVLNILCVSFSTFFLSYFSPLMAMEEESAATRWLSKEPAKTPGREVDHDRKKNESKKAQVSPRRALAAAQEEPTVFWSPPPPSLNVSEPPRASVLSWSTQVAAPTPIGGTSRSMRLSSERALASILQSSLFSPDEPPADLDTRGLDLAWKHIPLPYGVSTTSDAALATPPSSVATSPDRPNLGNFLFMAKRVATTVTQLLSLGKQVPTLHQRNNLSSLEVEGRPLHSLQIRHFPSSTGLEEDLLSVHEQMERWPQPFGKLAFLILTAQTFSKSTFFVLSQLLLPSQLDQSLPQLLIVDYLFPFGGRGRDLYNVGLYMQRLSTICPTSRPALLSIARYCFEMAAQDYHCLEAMVALGHMYLCNQIEGVFCNNNERAYQWFTRAGPYQPARQALATMYANNQAGADLSPNQRSRCVRELAEEARQPLGLSAIRWQLNRLAISPEDAICLLQRMPQYQGKPIHEIIRDLY